MKPNHGLRNLNVFYRVYVKVRQHVGRQRMYHLTRRDPGGAFCLIWATSPETKDMRPDLVGAEDGGRYPGR
jgi:hypothetical protein